MKLPIGSSATIELDPPGSQFTAQRHREVLAVAACRADVACSMPMGSGCMGMDKFLQLYLDRLPLSYLTTRKLSVANVV